MYIGYDARMQGAALNVHVAHLLQSDQPKPATDPVVYYTPNYRMTADNLIGPGSCWTLRVAEELTGATGRERAMA